MTMIEGIIERRRALRLIWLASLAGIALSGQTLTPVWVSVTEGGASVARVVVQTETDCPAIRLDGVEQAMTLRAPVPEGMRPVCEFTIPGAIRSASVNGRDLVLPRANPTKIAVIGDTGCRIKGARIQDCNDPTKWPLQSVSIHAAAEAPHLVIHVGDYLYREDKCPQDLGHLCGTSPQGDHWETWEADFFLPAAKLLAAAPWAFSRGNHEDCTRSWKGWFYYLDPRPWNNGSCEAYSAPYLVKLGAFELFMLDSSAAADRALNEKQIVEYAGQLASMHATNAWLVDHHPFWGMKAATGKTPAQAITAPLAEAWTRTSPQGIHLIVSGHTHLFELLSFDRNRPPQLVAGDGGTALAEALPATVNGTAVRGASIVASASRREFGYTLMTKSAAGWNLALRSPDHGDVLTCTIRGHRTACNEAKPIPRRALRAKNSTSRH